MSDTLNLESIRKSMNWSEAELLLIGYCVVSFERVMFLISGMVNANHEKRLALLDKTGGMLAEDVKHKFGEDNTTYKTFKSLVDDRNAIIHAFGFPNLEEEQWNRLYIKKGVRKKDIDERFMRKFIERCFDFFPILDLGRALQDLRTEKKK